MKALSSSKRKLDEKPNVDEACAELRGKIEKEISVNEANLKNKQREIYQNTMDKIVDSRGKAEHFQTKEVNDSQAKVKHIQSTFQEARKLQAELESEMLKLVSDDTDHLQVFFNEEIESFWNEVNSFQIKSAFSFIFTMNSSTHQS
jgi:hypothetical protein